PTFVERGLFCPGGILALAGHSVDVDRSRFAELRSVRRCVRPTHSPSGTLLLGNSRLLDPRQSWASARGKWAAHPGTCPRAGQRPSCVVRRQPPEEVQTGAARQVVAVLFVITTEIVNTFLIDATDGCVLVDARLSGRKFCCPDANYYE